MDDVATVELNPHATHDRLTRGARDFSPDIDTSRLLESPANGFPLAYHLSKRAVHEGSTGDTMHKLIFVRAGHLDIEGCLGGWLVLPGHMIVVPAQRAFNINGGRTTCLDVIHLDPESTPWPHHGCWVTRASPLAREMIGHAVSLSDEAASSSENSKQKKEKFKAYIAALSLLCGDWFQNPRMLFLPTAQSKVTSRLITYLRDNIANASVEEASTQIKLPQRSLHRYCMQEFGFNLRTLIREVRIVLAMELLSGTDQSIGAISSAVGFSSLSAFISAFKSRLGITPGEFLTQSRNACTAENPLF